MEPAGVALAIVATTDLCFKYGKVLVEACRTFRCAEIEINERIVCVESNWKRTTTQLEFIKRIWNQLDEGHQEIQSQILHILIGKLTVVNSKFEKLSRKKSNNSTTIGLPGDVRKLRYVLTKECLDNAIEDLDSWQKMFDPSWFLILKISSQAIDRDITENRPAISSYTNASNLRDALREQPQQSVSVFLPNPDVDADQVFDIPYASARRIQKPDSRKFYIADPIPYNPTVDINLATRNVRALARKLMSVDPFAFGILQCRGVVRMTEPISGKLSSFEFIFRVPEELVESPRSLRDYICSSEKVSLSTRLNIAKQLALSISYVHTLDFVHKNVRPETILGFQKRGSKFDSFFLVGFENTRTADGQTLPTGDLSWNKNLYRHPRCQGLGPEDRYSMQHDMYSLGVCLLEIGMWESFVARIDGSQNHVPTPALGLTLEGYKLQKPPTQVKDHLVSLTLEMLPDKMGERYTNIVLNCLTCLDQNNADFGDETEFTDEEGVLVGVKYIEKILLSLEVITA